MPDTLTQTTKLLVKLHGRNSQPIDLTQEAFTIGRKPDNSLAIEDPAVSGHHARIVKVQAVYFIEDLQSTNGTSVNGQSITRHQLHDADVITIGRHRLIFQDSGIAMTSTPAPSVDLERTMVLNGTSRTPDKPALSAKVLIVAGKTDRQEYPLIKQVNVIGSQEGATIRLAGWFAPKSAATIARRGQSYFISSSQREKALLVNGAEVTSQQELKDGDQVEVAGVKLTFYLLSQNSKASS